MWNSARCAAIAQVDNLRDSPASTNAFNGLKEGGHVLMDLQETFWSKLYGTVTDKYGIPWHFSRDTGEMRG